MCKVMVLFKAVVLQVGSVFYSSLFDKVTYNTGQPADAGWPVLLYLGSDCAPYIFTMPLKPMKAIARMPAEMSAMGMPFIEAGNSVRESCSRMPANTTRASVKPIAMEIA